MYANTAKFRRRSHSNMTIDEADASNLHCNSNKIEGRLTLTTFNRPISIQYFIDGW